MTSGEHSFPLSSTVFLLSPFQKKPHPPQKKTSTKNILFNNFYLNPVNVGYNKEMDCFLPLFVCFGLLVLLENLGKKHSLLLMLQSIPVTADRWSWYSRAAFSNLHTHRYMKHTHKQTWTMQTLLSWRHVMVASHTFPQPEGQLMTTSSDFYQWSKGSMLLGPV